jgi:predicted Rossmann-fold nucleotide-binding protein
VLVGREHWSRVISLDYLVEEGFIDAAERALVQCVDGGAEAAAIVEAHYR